MLWVLLGTFAMFLIGDETVGAHGVQYLCQQHLKQLAQSLLDYRDLNGDLPPLIVDDDSGRPAHSWRALILDQLSSPISIDLTQPWDGPSNRPLHATAPAPFQCRTKWNPVTTKKKKPKS